MVSGPKLLSANAVPTPSSTAFGRGRPNNLSPVLTRGTFAGAFKFLYRVFIVPVVFECLLRSNSVDGLCQCDAPWPECFVGVAINASNDGPVPRIWQTHSVHATGRRSFTIGWKKCAIFELAGRCGSGQGVLSGCGATSARMISDVPRSSFSSAIMYGTR